MTGTRIATLWQQYPLAFILLLGLVHGLIYLFLVPPWQHYDEPTHFEYAWIIANRPGLPQAGDFDQAMRRQVAISMLAHGFFRGLDFLPNLDAVSEPIWIGLSQMYHPPLYYLLTSIPLRFLTQTTVRLQLYAARFVSLLLYLLTIFVAGRLTREITRANNPLQVMVPVTLALLPGFTDLMTAVNNDVGATAMFSLFLWGSVQMIQSGLSPFRLLWVGATALACWWTKDTVILALPLAIAVLVFSVFRGSRQYVAWALVLVAGMAFVFTAFSWGDAALWYRLTSQQIPTRVTLSDAPVGNHAIQIETLPAPAPLPVVYQILPSADVELLRGKTVTLGAWMWATQPIRISSPIFFDGQSYFRDIEVTPLPAFYSVSLVVSPGARTARVILQGAREESVRVFFNGLVLVEGQRPLEESPVFNDVMGKHGVWGGLPFSNLLRNATAETSWPYLSPRFEDWIEKSIGQRMYFSTRGSLVLGSLLDWDSSMRYYTTTAKNLVRTFWAKFGWGHVSLPNFWYWIFGIFSLSGLGSACVAIWKSRRTLPWAALLVLSIAFGTVWAVAAVRGSQSLIADVFVPSARYAFPAIIPTVVALNLGWVELGQMVSHRWQVSSPVRWATFLLLFLSLDGIALSTLIDYYYIGG